MIIQDFVEIIKTISSDLSSKVYNKSSLQSALDVKEFCGKLLNCIYSIDYRKSIDMTPVVLELRDDNRYNNGLILEPTAFGEYLSSGLPRKNNLLKVDLKGNREETPSSAFLLDRESELLNFSTKDKDAVYFFISGYRLSVFQNGSGIYICENITTEKPIPRIEKGQPISQYKSLIKQHYKDCLDGECQTSYWQTKSKFKLKSAPEIIFQKSLAYFLSSFVTDGFVIEECLNNNTTDRTDITISAFTNYGLKNYILEIKWIGKSITSSTFDGKGAHTRANEGIGQLDIYLKRDSNAICGHLVVYDARERKENIIWENQDNWDCRIDNEPSIVQLSIDSASSRAKK